MRLRKEVGLTAGNRRFPTTNREEVSRRLADSSCARERYRMAETRKPLGKQRYTVRLAPGPTGVGRA
jgi:hypothetical protein